MTPLQNPKDAVGFISYILIATGHEVNKQRQTVSFFGKQECFEFQKSEENKHQRSVSCLGLKKKNEKNNC